MMSHPIISFHVDRGEGISVDIRSQENCVFEEFISSSLFFFNYFYEFFSIFFYDLFTSQFLCREFLYRFEHFFCFCSLSYGSMILIFLQDAVEFPSFVRFCQYSSHDISIKFFWYRKVFWSRQYLVLHP